MLKGVSGMILNKKEMTEEDIKHQYITPAIEKMDGNHLKLQWKKQLQMEK